jgi:hypothetical protein
MLYGRWERDLERQVELEVGDIRRKAWGRPDISANPFRASCSSLATLYDAAGEFSDAAINTAMESAGFWQLMQRVQRDCIGMREMVVVPHVDEAGALLLRSVSPDLVWATGSPMEPDEPYDLVEAVSRNGKWMFERYTVSDGVGVWRVYDAARELVSETSGDAYPWRYADGTPFVPHVVYHAARTCEMWDPFEGVELVEGTLRLGVLYTFYGHCVKNASWPQRYILNARPSGAASALDGTLNPSQQAAIVTDPSTALSLEGIEDAGQPMIGQWQAASDPDKMLESILAYERRIYAMAGLSPADAQRVAGDPRSGFALAINQENKRADQQRYAPNFRRGDEALAARVGALLGLPAPTEPYRVRYAFEASPVAVPQSPEAQANQPQENAP